MSHPRFAVIVSEPLPSARHSDKLRQLARQEEYYSYFAEDDVVSRHDDCGAAAVHAFSFGCYDEYDLDIYIVDRMYGMQIFVPRLISLDSDQKFHELKHFYNDVQLWEHTWSY